MTMIIAKARTTTTELLIEVEAPRVGVGSTPVLQHFPIEVAPRIGEDVEVGGGKFVVTKVSHVFNVSEENRHTVWVNVQPKK